MPVTSIPFRQNTLLSCSKNTLMLLDNYLKKAIHEKTGIVEILDYLLAGEAKTKKNRAVENQIKMSGFPYRKTLEQFDFDFQPSLNKEQIMELATMRFVENKESVVFLGTPGIGKTHLAVSLGMIAAQHRYSTYYSHNLITQLNKAHYENRLQERLINYVEYKVLIVDEIGYLPMGIQGLIYSFIWQPRDMKRIQQFPLRIKPFHHGIKCFQT